MKKRDDAKSKGKKETIKSTKTHRSSSSSTHGWCPATTCGSDYVGRDVRGKPSSLIMDQGLVMARIVGHPTLGRNNNPNSRPLPCSAFFVTQQRDRVRIVGHPRRVEVAAQIQKYRRPIICLGVDPNSWKLIQCYKAPKA